MPDEKNQSAGDENGGAVEVYTVPLSEEGVDPARDLKVRSIEQAFGKALKKAAEAERPSPQLILAAFSSAIAGVLARLSKVERHLGDSSELEALFQLAKRTLWLRLKRAHKDIEKVHQTASKVLTEPHEVLNLSDPEDVRANLAEAESLDPVSLGTKLQDRASRIHDVRNQLSILLPTLELLRMRLERFQAGRAQLTWDQIYRDLERIHLVFGRMKSTLLHNEEAEDASLSDLSRGLYLHFNGLGLHVNAQLEEGELRNLVVRKQLSLSPNDLYRVLFNLSDNARNAGATRVDIRVRKDMPNLVLIVQDNGPGFGGKNPLEAHKSSEAGHGYGVRGCQALVENTGGTLTPGDLTQEGAEWIITLPLIGADPR